MIMSTCEIFNKITTNRYPTCTCFLILNMFHCFITYHADIFGPTIVHSSPSTRFDRGSLEVENKKQITNSSSIKSHLRGGRLSSYFFHLLVGACKSSSACLLGLSGFEIFKNFHITDKMQYTK